GSAGEVDLLQHLRRDHALRRSRAGDPHRARPHDDPAPDRRPPRRHERRGRPPAAAGGRAAESLRRADDARRRPQVRGAGEVSDVWSERAQLYRESAAHKEGPDLDLLVEWARGARTALDVATGGGHVARRLREEGIEVVTTDAAPGMQPDVVTRAEHLPFA